MTAETNSAETNSAATDALSEDVEDLRATVHELAAQLQDTTVQVRALLDLGGPAGEAPPDPGGEDGQSEADGEDKAPPAPPLILRLPADQFDAELHQLDAWVRYVLVPTYLDEVSTQAPWCARWWEHPQAVARLHALWVAWQELTTPEAGGWTGPSVWHRDHLDPCMAALRAPGGPFAACMTNPDIAQHAVLPTPPAVPVNTPPGVM